jgi:hypothetical protein
VLLYRHLHSASRRMTAVRLAHEHRQVLHDLLRDATDRAERRVRERFRPILSEVLDDVGLRPRNLVEKVDGKKLVEELLDRILERGFLTIGDLRDALARNDLKLPDFSGLGDLWRGDPLLRADRRLAKRLEGVYRRGEFYHRGMQVLSSLAFGTRVGRFLTRYIALPFGGAYVIEAGVKYLLHKVNWADSGAPGVLSVVLLGLFLFGLLNVETFRHGVWGLLQRTYRGVRFACYEDTFSSTNPP